jgi:hypothetical protein
MILFKMIIEKIIIKDEEGSDRGLICGRILAFGSSGMIISE